MFVVICDSEGFSSREKSYGIRREEEKNGREREKSFYMVCQKRKEIKD
jgi:hypothetical protein